jgi:hypothetical protein
MDDGYKEKDGFILCTDSFSKEEVSLLIEELRSSDFNLNCTLRLNKSHYRIYILSESMSNFKSLVSPYFLESMMYKLA